MSRLAIRERWRVLSVAAFVVLPFLVQPTSTAQTSSSAPPSRAAEAHQVADSKPASRTFILVGAGDIASCKDPEGSRATVKLIEQIPGTVFAAGDLAYEKGTPAEFKNCYDPTWGRFKDRTRPALGNHEYGDHTAVGYFQYWGAQAGPEGKGFYSYDLGNWHIVVLNTNCGIRAMGGCATGSPQETWLRADLADHPNACILAYGHHALFSSGLFKSHALHPKLRPLWEDLYAAHADLILAGHEHSYERFTPQDAEGKADPERGIREIVVGTGGRSHDPLGFATPNSEVRNWETYGVLKLTLAPGKYDWEFVPEEGKPFHDSGSGICHNAQPAVK
ncbi:MAG TPA: metallophosphoesterase [Candidatus Acidoferrum sp.]|nr:metallophosphoesterase [Candidatus Acidoferrum sp.]